MPWTSLMVASCVVVTIIMVILTLLRYIATMHDLLLVD